MLHQSFIGLLHGFVVLVLKTFSFLSGSFDVPESSDVLQLKFGQVGFIFLKLLVGTRLDMFQLWIRVWFFKLDLDVFIKVFEHMTSGSPPEP